MLMAVPVWWVVYFFSPFFKFLSTEQLKVSKQKKVSEDKAAQTTQLFLPFTLILCSPLGWGKISTPMTTSPTASTPDAAKTCSVSGRQATVFVHAWLLCASFIFPRQSTCASCSPWCSTAEMYDFRYLRCISSLWTKFKRADATGTHGARRFCEMIWWVGLGWVQRLLCQL